MANKKWERKRKKAKKKERKKERERKQGRKEGMKEGRKEGRSKGKKKRKRKKDNRKKRNLSLIAQTFKERSIIKETIQRQHMHTRNFREKKMQGQHRVKMQETGSVKEI